MTEDPKQPLVVGNLTFEPVSTWPDVWRWQHVHIRKVLFAWGPAPRFVGWTAYADIVGDGGDFGPRIEAKLRRHQTPAEALCDLIQRLREHAVWEQEDAHEALALAGWCEQAATTIEEAIQEAP